MTNNTTIALSKATKVKLLALKLVPQESYENVVIRLMKFYKDKIRPRNYQPTQKVENMSTRDKNKAQGYEQFDDDME